MMRRSHRCKTCGAEFFSRNKLFQHLRDEGHADETVSAAPAPPLYEPSTRVFDFMKSCAGDDASPLPVIRIDLFNDGRAFVLRNMLTAAECDSCIAMAQHMGMHSVQAHGYTQRVRVCDRLVAVSEQLSSRMFVRIAPFVVPVDLTTRTARPRGVPIRAANALWRPHGLNETFRTVKYDVGGHFSPHLDGGHVRSSTDRSLQTCMLYLNDDFEGGRTRFFDESQEAYATPDPAKVVHTYVPRRGDALIFFSELMHDGEALTAGRKWILRSEVMYDAA